MAHVYKAGTKEFHIESRLLEGKSREEILRELMPRVGKEQAYTYQDNKGRRGRPSYDSIPKPLADQYRLFIWTVNKVITAMEENGWKNPETSADKRKWQGKERWAVRARQLFIKDLINKHVVDDPDGFSKVDPDYDPDKLYDQDGNEVIIPEPELTLVDHMEAFYKIMMLARGFVIQRELSGQAVDFISTRAIGDGCRAVLAGIAVKEVIGAVTKTWSSDTLHEFNNWNIPWKPTKPTIDVENYPVPLEGGHHYLGYVVKLAKGRIPIFLVGPSGCGKSFLARDLSEYLEKTYGEVPLTAGATPSWLAGAYNIKGYVSRPFVDIYENGGVFAQPLNAGVLTPEGWTTIGGLQTGDEIFGSDGEVQYVKKIYDRGEQQNFVVRFSDGTSTNCGSDHLWEVFSKNGKGYLKTTFDLIDDLFYKDGTSRWKIRDTPILKYCKKTLPLDPYLMGVLLGDGSFRSNNVKFYTVDDEIVEQVQKVLPKEYNLKFYNPMQYHICKKNNIGGNQSKGQNFVNQTIRDLGLMGCRSETKFIPPMYLQGNVEQRLALLNGMMDTDGSVCAKTSGKYATISARLCEDFCDLVRSLGGRPRVYANYNAGGGIINGRTIPSAAIVFEIVFALPEHLSMFRLSRKRDKFVKAHFRHQKKIVDIIPLKTKVLMRCITVSNEDGLYITDGGIITHNCFEELDAADPNMLLLVNNALANRSFTNPVTGKEILKHKDFIPVATANTWGLGANRQFTARERIDAATLDRWRVGRVEMDYDPNVERQIVDFYKDKAEKKLVKKAKKVTVDA